MSLKRCFVMMPFGSTGTYPDGHFDRVYEFLIRPACEGAGFSPIRADEVKTANLIVADIVREIIECDMVVCDLSARNPNVMYELGIRHAFNKPVALIRDSNTSRVFDIQGLRDMEYDASLRVDSVNDAITRLTAVIKETYSASATDITSPIQLLHMIPAVKAETATVSPEVALVLGELASLGDRMLNIENGLLANNRPSALKLVSLTPPLEPRGIPIKINDLVYHSKFGEGVVTDKKGETIQISFPGIGTRTVLNGYVRKVADSSSASQVLDPEVDLAERG